MTLKSKYKKVKLLPILELYQLADDVRAEIEENDYTHNDLTAWYLREKCYLPFSIIYEMSGYSTAEKAARAVSNLYDVGNLSMHDDYHELIFKLNFMSDRFYGLGNNPMLSSCHEYLKEALLYDASVVTGYKDNRRNGAWFSPTPQYSRLSTLSELEFHLKNGLSYEDIISNYQIIPIS